MRRGAIAAAGGLLVALLVLLDRPTPASEAAGAAGALPAQDSGSSWRRVLEHADPHASELRAHAASDLPHPITPEHLALYRDVDLLDGAWQAARAGDFDGSRAQLAEHGRAHPRSEDDMREGMALLIDCMQQGSMDARARARRFYDEQTHSMMRRRIRRHCLERPAHGAD